MKLALNIIEKKREEVSPLPQSTHMGKPKDQPIPEPKLVANLDLSCVSAQTSVFTQYLRERNTDVFGGR